ncbi:MAG: patatin-like phospholipase family protein [Thermomicrobiales bacterium]|nr:patatin-like phospholipase family protein [Thermomicrobiales bacterium]
MRRRTLLSALAGGALAAGAAGNAVAGEGIGSGASRRSPALRQEATPVAGLDDGLAHPIPYTPPLGTGKDRALVLGGGGVYLLSFYMGYFNTLLKNGVDLSQADLIVGTSAGSLGGAILASGMLAEVTQELDALGSFPFLFGKLAPGEKPNPSQQRAKQITIDATDASPETIQKIGRAAMAARNPDGPFQYENSVEQVIGITDWPSAGLHTTAVDCYSGEQLIVSQEDGIPINVACGASSSLPGGTGPTWLRDRLCMDGGMCQTSTHCDVVAGVKKALVFSLSVGGPAAVPQGLRTSGMPNTLQQEIADLEAGGTETILVVAGLEPGSTKIDSIMDPKYILPQIAFGQTRAEADLDKIKAFWG